VARFGVPRIVGCAAPRAPPPTASPLEPLRTIAFGLEGSSSPARQRRPCASQNSLDALAKPFLSAPLGKVHPNEPLKCLYRWLPLDHPFVDPLGRLHGEAGGSHCAKWIATCGCTHVPRSSFGPVTMGWIRESMGIPIDLASSSRNPCVLFRLKFPRFASPSPKKNHYKTRVYVAPGAAARMAA